MKQIVALLIGSFLFISSSLAETPCDLQEHFRGKQNVASGNHVGAGCIPI